MSQKQPLTLIVFLLRLLSGFGGGVAGTLVAFVVYFLMLSLVPSGDSSSLSVFIIILISFAATLVANTSTAAIVSFMDERKYSRRKTILTHVFLFNLILFIITIPLYILGVSLDIVTAIAASHLLLSAFISALIMEVLAGYEFALLGIYTSSFGIFMTMGLALALTSGGANSLLITFGAMPVVWLLLQASNGFGEWMYDTFIRFYGLEALNAQTDLGGDAEPEEKEDEEDEMEEGEEERS